MDMARPSSGYDQQEDPIKIQHPEEEENHESGASKMLKRVKAKAKKIKNSLTKHDNDNDQDLVEEEDDDGDIDEQLRKVHDHNPPGGVTDQPLSHPRETNVPASEEIIPPGTTVFPVASSDYIRPIEPELLRNTTHGHEAPSYPVRSTDTSDREETGEELSHPVRVSDLSEREESREAHHVPLDTHVPFVSETEDVERKFAPHEDEFLGGQRELNVETPKRSEEERSGVSTYQSNVTDHTQQGGVPEIAESLGNLKVTDEEESGLGFERDFSSRSHESDMVTESGIGDGGGSGGAELGKDVPIISSEFDQKTDKNSPRGYVRESGFGVEEVVPTKSHEFEQKAVSGNNEDLPTGFGGESGDGKREEFLAKSLVYNEEIESGIGKDSLTELPEDLPVRSHELKEDSGVHGSEAGVEKIFPVRSDETELGREIPTGRTHDQYSSELSRPKERDDYDSSVEVTRDETQETEHTTYAEQTGSATSVIADKVVATKNAVASGLGYSGETTGADEQYESPKGVETLGTGHKVEENVEEKLTPVELEKTGSTEMRKLPLSGGGNGEDLSAAEKVRPGEEDKALWGKLKEEREQGEAVAEEEKAGVGMVGKIKGAYNYWLGGTTEEVKPKSPTSVEESSQSLGSTVGTKGFPDSGESGLGETGGAVPVHKGL